MSKIWKNSLEQLKKQTSVQQFSVWIAPIKAVEQKNTITLTVASKDILDNIEKKFKNIITKTIKNFNKDIKIIFNFIEKQTKKYTSNLSAEFSFDTLVEGNANHIPLAVGKQIANNIKNPTYNPFVVYGGSGLGKTHLMQATGNLALKNNPKLKIIYMPLMDFVKNITAGLRYKNIEQIKTYYQNADLLLVDDIHLIANKEKSQEEFFHIFNFLFNTKKQIIFTCDQIPKNIDKIEDRLKTRFSQGINVEMMPPELEMRAAILMHKAQSTKINIKINENIALYIASHINSNVRDLEGALLKLKAYVEFSKLHNATITKEMTEEALKDLIKPRKLNIDIFDIQKATAKQYGITTSELVSNKRKQHLVKARQTAIYLSYKLTELSLTKIGKNFGNRDHSTVLYSCDKFKKLIITNEELKQNYEAIKLKLSTN